MANERILWADDEIELLKPHIIFLEKKGYEITTCNSGNDAVDQVRDSYFDVVFLDENMPGVSGLEALAQIKEIDPTLPVIMITKSEEESIMEEAIGSRISDYLIKPVNPNQILMSIKKNLDGQRIRSEAATTGYQQEFRQIAMRLMDRMDMAEWGELYKKLVHWELTFGASDDKAMEEIFVTQKQEANQQFCKYIHNNYQDLLADRDAGPVMSHTLMERKVFPILDASDDPVYVMVIDNLRYDQWKILQPKVAELFRVEDEALFCAILPTATQYARNALFAGLMPLEIQRSFPQYWKGENDEGSKNQFEGELLGALLKRKGYSFPWSYHKITNLRAGKKLADNFHQLQSNRLSVVVYNFVDMLSHARTDMEVIKELADDEAAYRSLTSSWFEHSPLFDMMRQIAESGARMIITTDHGTIRVDEPNKIVGDRNTNTNLRYKLGKNLNYDARNVLEFRQPEDVMLPRENVSSAYVFAMENDYFVYPNNYNHFVNFYRNTFQHGGVSMEEMLIPFINLVAR